MAEYTVYIPKEFFTRGVTDIQVLIVIVVILAVIAFFGYKLLKVTSLRRKEESF